MAGEPIQAVNSGLTVVRDTMRMDPNTNETAWLSVITFGSDAKQIVPLTEAVQFQPPVLTAGGSRALGSVLKKVVECVENEVVKGTKEKKGDWRPIVFIITCGEPTDDYKSGIQEFKKCKWGQVVVYVVGSDANIENFHEITENVVAFSSTDTTVFADFLKWLWIDAGTEVKETTGSCNVHELPPPPPEISFV